MWKERGNEKGVAFSYPRSRFPFPSGRYPSQASYSPLSIRSHSSSSFSFIFIYFFSFLLLSSSSFLSIAPREIFVRIKAAGINIPGRLVRRVVGEGLLERERRGVTCVPPSLAKQRKHYHPSKPRVRTYSPPPPPPLPLLQSHTILSFYSPSSLAQGLHDVSFFVSTVYNSLDPSLYGSIWLLRFGIRKRLWTLYSCICNCVGRTRYFCWVYMNPTILRYSKGVAGRRNSLPGGWLSYSFHSLRRIDVALDAEIVGVVHQGCWYGVGWKRSQAQHDMSPPHPFFLYLYLYLFLTISLSRLPPVFSLMYINFPLTWAYTWIFDYFTNKATCDSSLHVINSLSLPCLRRVKFIIITILLY